ncbi:hypothetical protein HDV00_010259 [Rhizophlyctis rosea]|nr:hypothetical protein HDV00_010259 [Rhizophlyctis rosea]
MKRGPGGNQPKNPGGILLSFDDTPAPQTRNTSPAISQQQPDLAHRHTVFAPVTPSTSSANVQTESSVCTGASTPMMRKRKGSANQTSWNAKRTGAQPEIGGAVESSLENQSDFKMERRSASGTWNAKRTQKAVSGPPTPTAPSSPSSSGHDSVPAAHQGRLEGDESIELPFKKTAKKPGAYINDLRHMDKSDDESSRSDETDTLSVHANVEIKTVKKENGAHAAPAAETALPAIDHRAHGSAANVQVKLNETETVTATTKGQSAGAAASDAVQRPGIVNALDRHVRGADGEETVDDIVLPPLTTARDEIAEGVWVTTSQEEGDVGRGDEVAEGADNSLNPEKEADVVAGTESTSTLVVDNHVQVEMDIRPPTYTSSAQSVIAASNTDSDYPLSFDPASSISSPALPTTSPVSAYSTMPSMTGALNRFRMFSRPPNHRPSFQTIFHSSQVRLAPTVLGVHTTTLGPINEPAAHLLPDVQALHLLGNLYLAQTLLPDIPTPNGTNPNHEFRFPHRVHWSKFVCDSYLWSTLQNLASQNGTGGRRPTCDCPWQQELCCPPQGHDVLVMVLLPQDVNDSAAWQPFQDMGAWINRIARIPVAITPYGGYGADHAETYLMPMSMPSSPPLWKIVADTLAKEGATGAAGWNAIVRQGWENAFVAVVVAK